MIDTPAEMLFAAAVLVLFAVAFVLTIIPVSDWFARRSRTRQAQRKLDRARGIR